MAQLAIRLCDLRPDGTSALITHGFLNLAMADAFEKPKRLEVGKKNKVMISLDQIAYYVPEGHRIRVAISTSYWPFIWPSPEKARIKVFSGSLKLPRDVDEKLGKYKFFEGPVFGKPWDCSVKRSSISSRNEYVDDFSGSRVIELKNDSGKVVDNDHGLETDSSAVERWKIKDGDPLSAEIETDWFQSMRRENWYITTEAKLTVKCNKNFFFINASIIA